MSESSGMEMNEIGGRPIYGPERPPQYGMAGSSWNFGSLEDEDEAGAGNLIVSVEEHGGMDDDAASTTAQMDHDQDLFDVEEDRYEDASSGPFYSYAQSARNTPVDDVDLGIYDTELQPLHLEDAGTVGAGEDDDMPSLGDPELLGPQLSHDKVD
jgi:hypothetical protein